MDLGLHRKGAIVTGASKGIGRTIALRPAQDGASMFLLISVPRAVASANASLWRSTHTLATARAPEIRTTKSALAKGGGPSTESDLTLWPN